MMSDELHGNVPALEDESGEADITSNFVMVVAARRVGAEQQPVTGALRTVLFDPTQPEIEIRVEMKDAFDIIEANNQVFDKFDLHHGERIVPMAGPFVVKAARIQDIDVVNQVCTLGLLLDRASPAMSVGSRRRPI